MIRDTFARADLEERSGDWFTAFKDLTTPVAAGVSVTQDNAVNLPAVYKCVSLNAETIGSLPIDVYAKRGKVRVPYPEPVWLKNPNPYQTMAEFVAMTQTSLDLDGNAFWIKAVDGAGRVVGLSLLPPSSVEPRMEDVPDLGEVLVYWVTLRTERKPFPANSIVHLRSTTLPGQLRGLSPIACAKQTIGIGFAAEQFGAQYFGSGIHPSGVIESTASLNQEQIDLLKANFTKKHAGISQSHALGVLFGGATFKPITVTADDSQFLEARRYTAAEIANLYGVPVEFVGDGVKGAAGYVTGVAMRFRMWYLTGLMPRMVRIETAFSSLLPRPAYVKFNRNALLQMDPSERVAYYAAAQMGEWMSVEEIREKEDMDPQPRGTVLHSVQWQENAPPDSGGTDESDAAASGGLFDGGAE